MKQNTLYNFDVFFSFAGKDEEQAKSIWYELSLSGLKVFWSNETLKKNVGQSFFTVIQNALEGSRHFLLLCTQNSMESSWVQEEYQSFYTHFHLPSKKQRRLILFHEKDFNRDTLPVLLKNLQTSISIKEIIQELGGKDIQQIIVENDELKEKLSNLEKKYQLLRNKFDKLPPQIGPKKIFLVDDEEPIHLLYREELQEKGYEVYSAYSGAEALRIYDEIDPDLVILDVNLGKNSINGIEVLRQLRLKDDHTPIILNTAYQQFTSDIAAWAAQEYLVKSSNMSELFAALEKHLGSVQKTL